MHLHRPDLQLLLALLVLGTAAAQWPTTDPTLAQWSGPVAIDCLCSDAVPRSAYTENISTAGTCEEQQGYGYCGQAYMLDSVKELPEGLSCLTCST